MSYHLEVNQGLEITDEDEFQKEVCGRCKWKEICEAWGFETTTTLYHNKVAVTGEPYEGATTGKKGVYRCSSFESVEHIELLKKKTIRNARHFKKGNMERS